MNEVKSELVAGGSDSQDTTATEVGTGPWNGPTETDLESRNHVLVVLKNERTIRPSDPGDISRTKVYL